MEMKTTAGQIAKNFGEYADKALTEPVNITKYGREHLVLLSAAEYERLKRRDRQVYRAGDIPDDLLEAISSAEPSKDAEAYNAEYKSKAGK